MKNASLKILFIISIVLAGSYLQAAHLVGGQISYECIGNGEYRIRLRVYRDCAGGGAQFDTQANIAIYDTANNLITMLTPTKGATINVPPDSTGNPCVSAPPGLCTEYADYLDSIVLPPVPGGYVITHQRCCRNNSIDNVVNPGSIGNTYTVSIPSNDTTCNSSAEFVGVAPIVICMGKELNMPLRIKETDGDSLYIELCRILEGGASGGGGGGCNTTIPNPPCPPPYVNVTFGPSYSYLTPVPSSPIFAVHPQTGTITGTPNALGKYVLGICVTEYRKGIPLSTTRLDYQFNVSNCVSTIVADMVTPLEDPEVECDGLTVQFTSEVTTTPNVFWKFGDPTSLVDTSSKANPKWRYPAPGKYTVTLIAGIGSGCGDTTETVFEVQPPVYPDYSFNGIFCLNANKADFDAIGYYPNDATFAWEFGADANIPTYSQKTPPTINWSAPGKKIIKLTVAYDACVKEYIDSLEISNFSSVVSAGPDFAIKVDEVVEVTGSGGQRFEWTASHPVYFGSPFNRSTAIKPTPGADTITIYMRATDHLGCEGIDSLYLFVDDDPGIMNLITPNDDGRNDYFDLSQLNPDGNCKLTIMNRYGSEVWVANEYKNDWKGVNKGGNELPDGTYYYILECGTELRHVSAITIWRLQ